MHDEQDLLALAAQSGKNDLAFLLKAKEDAKRRMSENPSPENSKAFSTAKAAVDAEVEKLQPAAPGLTFKTQLAAVDYLTAQGFKVGKSKFNDDVKKHKRIPLNADGHFDAAVLLAYAGVNLTPLARAEDAKGSAVATSKVAADTRLREVQAARQELKFQREQGLFMLKSEHEAGLSARALFFKNEIESFIRLRAASIIQLVGGREEAAPLLIEWWDDTTADWMDSWSKDREFVIDDEPKGDETGPGGEEIAEDLDSED